MNRSSCFNMAATIIRDLKRPHMKELALTNKEAIKTNFKRLALVSSVPEESLSFLFFKMGLDKETEYKNVSFIKDSDLYDVVDTYNLCELLKSTNGNWDSTWNLIESELTKTGDEYGVAAKETISKFENIFKQVKDAVMNCYDVEYKDVIFSNFYWKGNSLYFQPF